MRRRHASAGWGLTAALLAALASGCEAPSWIAKLVTGPGNVKALYKLPNKPTLFLVDDPQHLLGGPEMTGVVANNVAFHFRQQKKSVINAPIISQQALDTYAATRGDQFTATPIDQVGRDLGADTVVHVQVMSVDLNVTGSMSRPKATVQVKVIDATNGQRLWPISGKLDDSSQAPPAYQFAVEMPYRDVLQQQPTPGMQRMMDRELAEQIGLDVARLFYKWTRPEPGHTL